MKEDCWIYKMYWVWYFIIALLL